AAGPEAVRRTEHPPAVQAEHVRRYSSDLRVELVALSGDDRKLVRSSRWGKLAAEPFRLTGPGSAGAHGAVWRLDHLLLLLLHGASLQLARDGRELEEVGGFHPGHTPRAADGRVHRPRAHAPDRVGFPLCDPGLLAARDFDFQVQCSVLFWRDIPADHRGGRDGLPGAGGGTPDVPSIRRFDEEGEPARLQPPRAELGMRLSAVACS